MLATGSLDKTVKLWTMPDGDCLATLSGHGGAVRCTAFNADGTTVASCGDDGMVRLWRVWSGQCLMQLPGHGGRVWCVQFSPTSNNTLVSTGDDGELLLWTISEGADHSDDTDVLTEFDCVSIGSETPGLPLLACALCADEMEVAGCRGDGVVTLWRMSGQRLAAFEGHTAAVKCCAFHPKAPLLASVAQDGTLRLWDLEAAREGMNVN